MPDPNPPSEPASQAGEHDDLGASLAGLSGEAEHALRRELGALFGAAGPPPAVGAAIARAAAGVRARPRSAPRRWTRAAPIVLAAAAALAVVLLGLRELHTPDAVGVMHGTAATATAMGDVDVADFDASGRVDVWDAYLVARALESGAVLSGALDLDRDGRVTRADADRIAQRAVEVVR